MKITYIHHSCFVVELDDCILIFDYYKGELPAFDPDKRIIFFVSHSHGDHFNPNIYKYAETCPHVIYVLSGDVRRSLSFARTGLEMVDKTRFLWMKTKKFT